MRRQRKDEANSPRRDKVAQSGGAEVSRRAFVTSAAAIGAAVAPFSAAVAGMDRFGRDRDWSGDEPVSYPDPAWEVKDPRFTGRLGNAPLQRLWHGVGNDAALWCEGPVWMG